MSEQQSIDFSGEMPTSRVLQYTLTGKRQLLRILDIGLIVPELVARNFEGELLLLEGLQLPGIANIEGCPPDPILIELKELQGVKHKTIPAERIKAIHFSSKEEREDYAARIFENVPNNLFQLLVSPDLFVRDANISISATLPRINKQEICDKYRHSDVMAGLLWEYLHQVKNIDCAVVLINRVSAEIKYSTDLRSLHIELILQAADISIDDIATEILGAYIQIIGQHDIDEGWVALEILEKIKESIPASVVDQDLFKKWYEISYSILNNERDLIPFTDENQIALRAVLLHLLNPDADSLKRMAKRNSALGKHVFVIANLLASARLGFAAKLAAEKQKYPGGYFLVTEILSSALNSERFSSVELAVEDVGKGTKNLLWKKALVGEFQSEPEIQTGKVTETENPYKIGMDISSIALLLKGLPSIVAVKCEDTTAIIDLEKTRLKLLPKHANFTVNINGKSLIFSTTLLDLKAPAQIKKLTGVRLMAILEYQYAERCDFRFELKKDESLKAVICIPLEKVSSERLMQALDRLVSVQLWMKVPKIKSSNKHVS